MHPPTQRTGLRIPQNRFGPFVRCSCVSPRRVFESAQELATTRPDRRDLQDLNRLITVRDAILHARAPRPAPRPGLAAVMADLRRADLPVPHEGASANVFFELATPRLAVWAYCSARRIILAMLDLVPTNVGALSSLRDVLRDPIRFPSDRCRGSDRSSRRAFCSTGEDSELYT